ncbi:hypothetical protein QQ045_008854 [Rhodiola kirilowii]
MGGACCKASGTQCTLDLESPREGLMNRGFLEKGFSKTTSLNNEEGAFVKGRVDSRDGRSIDKRHGSSKLLNDEEKKRREKEDAFIARYGATSSIPKALHWDKEAPRWPSWLLSVASEAVKGWVPRRADTFDKISKIGQGTYSEVYKAQDASNVKIVALKRVCFDNKDPESVKFMAREIILLRRCNKA